MSEAHLKTSASYQSSAKPSSQILGKGTYPPKRIDATLRRNHTRRCQISRQEDDGCEHAQQHDTEAWTRMDQFHDRVLVVLIDYEHQLDGGEYPPWISGNMLSAYTMIGPSTWLSLPC